jgi:DNA/RNA-binding domain of Phe-tRNA-synthetase-like protein
MAFCIDPEIWEKFPGMRLVVAVASHLDNERDRPEARKLLSDAQNELNAEWTYENPQSHPRVQAWREAFQRIGVKGKDFPSSIEALVRRVVAGKRVASINPLVDLYNAVSLRFIVPVGGWDVAGLAGGDIHLRITREGERFQELGGQSGPVTVAAGEVSYTDAQEIITRHFVWRQSEHAKVGPKTREIFLVSEILPAAESSLAEEVEHALLNGLGTVFGATPRSAILEPGTLHWDWR